MGPVLCTEERGGSQGKVPVAGCVLTPPAGLVTRLAGGRSVGGVEPPGQGRGTVTGRETSAPLQSVQTIRVEGAADRTAGSSTWLRTRTLARVCARIFRMVAARGLSAGSDILTTLPSSRSRCQDTRQVGLEDLARCPACRTAGSCLAGIPTTNQPPPPTHLLLFGRQFQHSREVKGARTVRAARWRY